jgi:hypothetical protein
MSIWYKTFLLHETTMFPKGNTAVLFIKTQYCFICGHPRAAVPAVQEAAPDAVAVVVACSAVAAPGVAAAALAAGVAAVVLAAGA